MNLKSDPLFPFEIVCIEVLSTPAQDFVGVFSTTKLLYSSEIYILFNCELKNAKVMYFEAGLEKSIFFNYLPCNKRFKRCSSQIFVLEYGG